MPVQRPFNRDSQVRQAAFPLQQAVAWAVDAPLSPLVHFVLSLPLAPMDYVRAKLLGTTVTYLIPWCVLSVGAIVLIAITTIPDGLIPLTILLLVYFLFTFSVMSAVALFLCSEAKMTLAIIFTNMSLTFFMFGVSRIHGIGYGLERGAAPAWTGSFFTVLAAELALIVIALGAPLYFQPRRKEFI